MELTAIIEALLIASEAPLPSSELARLIRARVDEAEDTLAAQIENGEVEKNTLLPVTLKVLANIDEKEITSAIAKLNDFYQSTGRAFVCLERAKGWKIYSRPEYAEFIRLLFPDRKPRKLSGPAMETLAIVAYRQPITKAAIEAVRGVSCDGMLQKLLDRELIKIGGRSPLPGRPLLYETTDLFFEHFGIKSVDDLPNASELRAVKLPEPGSEEDLSAKESSQAPVETQLAFSAIHHRITEDSTE